jgi:hypothetical protein
MALGYGDTSRDGYGEAEELANRHAVMFEFAA